MKGGFMELNQELLKNNYNIKTDNLENNSTKDLIFYLKNLIDNIDKIQYKNVVEYILIYSDTCNMIKEIFDLLENRLQQIRYKKMIRKKGVFGILKKIDFDLNMFIVSNFNNDFIFNNEKNKFILRDKRKKVGLGNKYRSIMPEEFNKFCNKILKALECIHNMRFIHFDLKPDNIMVDKDLNPYLIDFGFATTIPSDPESIAGTNGFINPNFFSIKNDRFIIDGRVDLWSFLVTISLIISLNDKLLWINLNDKNIINVKR